MGLLLLIIVFTCVLDTVSQTAKISGHQSEVLEGGTFTLRCAIFQMNEGYRGELHMYLCKNGVGIRMDILIGSKGQEATFSITDAKKEDSGNYSCMVSRERHVGQTVTTVDKHSIFIQVKEFGMARIFVKNTHVVFEGDNVDLKCAVLETDTHNWLHIYLCKNGTGVSMEVAQASGEAHFTLKQVRREDSGNYSCVYSIKRYHPSNVSSTNENSVIIQVKDKISDIIQVKNNNRERDIHQWWVNVIRLLCSAGVVIAAVAVLTIPHLWNRKEKNSSSK